MANGKEERGIKLIKGFLICFPMKYRDFSVKINSENNCENCIKKELFYEFSAKSLKMWYHCLKLLRGR